MGKDDYYRVPHSHRVQDPEERVGKVKQDHFRMLAYSAMEHKAMIQRMAADARKENIGAYSARKEGMSQNSKLDVFIRRVAKWGTWKTVTLEVMEAIISQNRKADNKQKPGGKTRTPAISVEREKYRIRAVKKRISVSMYDRIRSGGLDIAKVIKHDDVFHFVFIRSRTSYVSVIASEIKPKRNFVMTYFNREEEINLGSEKVKEAIIWASEKCK